jgi:hypothetical protein
VTLASLDKLTCIKPTLTTILGGFDTLAINNASHWACRFTLGFTRCHNQNRVETS